MFLCVLQGIPGYDGPPGGQGPRGSKVLLYFHLLEARSQIAILPSFLFCHHIVAIVSVTIVESVMWFVNLIIFEVS